MFEHEWLPNALSIGITEDEFWALNPHRINIRLEAYNLKLKRLDEYIWAACGGYVTNAVYYAVDKCLAGNKSKAEYIEKPMYSADDEEDNEKEKAVSESREEVAIFEMKQRIKLLRKQGLPESPD
jgi:hypothetical protein